MNKADFEKHSNRFWLMILAAAAYFLLMFGNGMLSLTHPDEVFYMQSAKEMIQYRSWFVPMIFDWPQFEKPVFFYWLLILGIKFFGLSPFVARLWPAIFGIIGVLAVFGMAWVMFRSKRTAFFSGMVLTVSFIHLAMSRALLTDMTFSILTILSLASFCFGYYERRYRDAGIFLFFVFMGLAVLTKGLLGVCFPFTVVLSFLMSQKELKFFKTPAAVWGTAVFLAIAVPWHFLMYKWYGSTFIQEYWFNVHVRRLFVAEHPRNDTWYFYLLVMFAGMMPFSLLWPALLKSITQTVKKGGGDSAKLTLLISWILSTYGFVQVAHSKLASYILPVFPAIAILMGYYLNRSLELFERNAVTPKAIVFSGYGMAVFLIIGAVAGNIVAEHYREVVIHKQPVYFASVLAVVWGGMLIALNRKRKYFFLTVANAGVTLVLLIVIFLGIPMAEPWVSCKSVMDEFKTIDQSRSVILTSKFYVRGVRYYSDRPVAVINLRDKGFFSPHPIPFLSSEQKVLDFIKGEQVIYAIVRKNDLDELRRIAEGHYRLAELGGAFGGKHIVKIESK